MTDLPSIIDGKLFQLCDIEEDIKDSDLLKAKCLLCPTSKAPISGSKKASSNFLTHLKRCHPASHTFYESAKKKKLDSNLDHGKGLVKQKTMFEFSKSSKCSQNEATSAISSFIIESGSPISIVEHKSFKNMVEKLSGGASFLSFDYQKNPIVTIR